jgi:hypothetical protein
MKHFIITRFNDYFPDDNPSTSTAKNYHLGIENSWLEKRMEIFLQITVPSVVAQTDKEFDWIVKCHPKTPDWAKKKLSLLPLIACYDETPPQNSIKKQASISFHKAIRKITQDKEIITSRLDTDDGLSNIYIKKIKENIRPKKFVDFTKGVVKTSHGLFYHYKHGHASQFCSYLDFGESLDTVYHEYHSMIKNPIKINEKYLGWLQNNHDFNITAEHRKQLEIKIGHSKYTEQVKSSDDQINKFYPFINEKNYKNNKLFL